MARGGLPQAQSPPVAGGGGVPLIQGRAHLRSSPPRSLPAGSCPWREQRLVEWWVPSEGLRGTARRPALGGGGGRLERALQVLLRVRLPAHGPAGRPRSPLQAPVAAASTPPADLKGAAPRGSGTLGRARGVAFARPSPSPIPCHRRSSAPGGQDASPYLVPTPSETLPVLSEAVLYNSLQEVEREALSKVGRCLITNTKTSL